jgi:hypothetical protein
MVSCQSNASSFIWRPVICTILQKNLKVCEFEFERNYEYYFDTIAACSPTFPIKFLSGICPSVRNKMAF